MADHVAVNGRWIEGAVEPAAAPVVGDGAEQRRGLVLAVTGACQVVRDTLPRLGMNGEDAHPAAIAGDPHVENTAPEAEIAHAEAAQLLPGQPLVEQDGQNGPVAPALQRVPGGRVEKPPRLRAPEHRRRVGFLVFSRPLDPLDRVAPRRTPRHQILE